MVTATALSEGLESSRETTGWQGVVQFTEADMQMRGGRVTNF